MTDAPANYWLIIGGALSIAACLMHIACIIGGPDCYRFLGAGEAMALAAERGRWFPAVVTMGIAMMLAVWGAFAFSGAGLIRHLPLMKIGLVLITAIYLARGLCIFVPDLWRPDLSISFKFWSSLIVLVFGLTYAVGTWQAWPHLSSKDNSI